MVPIKCRVTISIDLDPLKPMTKQQQVWLDSKKVELQIMAETRVRELEREIERRINTGY